MSSLSEPPPQDDGPVDMTPYNANFRLDVQWRRRDLPLMLGGWQPDDYDYSDIRLPFRRGLRTPDRIIPYIPGYPDGSSLQRKARVWWNSEVRLVMVFGLVVEFLLKRMEFATMLAKALPRAKRDRDLRVSGREALARTREVGGSGRRAVARRRYHPPAQVQLMLDSTILMKSESDGARYYWDPSDALETTLFIIVVPGEDESGQGKSKTLLIGVNDIPARVVEGEESKEPDKWLKAPDKDVDKMKHQLSASDICQESDVVVMTESPSSDPLLWPTKANIIHQMKRLVLHAKAGDKFFFYYTGHGRREEKSVPVSREMDCYPLPLAYKPSAPPSMEVTHGICPSDVRQSGVITSSDSKYDLLIKPLAPGSRLFCLFDCCFSGGMLQLPEKYHYGDTGSPHRWRFRCPNLLPQNWGKTWRQDPIDVKVIACQDDQPTYGVEKDGEHVGLVTWAFLTVLRMLVDLMTWGMLLNKLGETLAADSLLIDVKDAKGVDSYRYQWVGRPRLLSLKAFDLNTPVWFLS